VDANGLLDGFAVAFQPENLLFAFVGVFVGSLVGVLPGIGPILTISILLPFTFGMEPTAALIMMAGIYYGGMYGGSTTSIMLNLPGENASVVTTFDGYPMRLQGRAGPALGIVAIASFVAGLFAVCVLAFFASPMAQLALLLGPPEMFLLLICALSLVGVLGEGSTSKSLTMLGFGLVLALVGTDLFSGQPRLTFGQPELLSGVELIPVVIGLFALGEIFYCRPRPNTKLTSFGLKIRELMPTRDDLSRSAMPIARSSVVGTALGVVPGGGPAVASYVTYGLERAISKDRSRFGKGAIEGVAAPEAANNAAATGALIPLLTLGIPSSGAAAIIMSAFVMYGLQPGPALFEDNPSIAWGLIASMFIGNVMLLVLNLPLVGLFVQILRVPYPLLAILTVFLSVLGTYSINGQMWDVWVMAIFGVVGLVARLLSYPLAPLVLGLVLGHQIETSLRQALLLSDSGWGIFLERPACMVIIAAAAAGGLLWAGARVASSRRRVLIDA
jgi:putative tricarboxylic transport membrane protein